MHNIIPPKGVEAELAVLDIVTYPDQRLNQVCRVVEEIDEETQAFIDDLVETLHSSSNGVGLAAPQVGDDRRIIACDIDFRSNGEKNPLVLINPEIIEAEGEVLSEEGCLSCPEVTVDVPRAERVKVVALDRDGNPVEIESDDFLAIVLQHETDHLDGELIVNNLSSLKRKLYRRKLKKLQEEA